MIGDLFSRIFLRFLIALAASMMLLVMLFHLFQKRIVLAEWQSDLESEAVWLARHTRAETAPALAKAWGSMHREIHLRIFDPQGRKIADSHPDRRAPAPSAVADDAETFGFLLAAEPLRGDHLLVLSRRWIPAFPHGFRVELAVSAVAILAVVALVLWPFVRSLSRTLRRMTEAAEAVSAGHLGRTVGVERSDELGRLIQAFDDMSRQLAEVEQLETRLLHDVSHELRSPLGRIRVMAETIAHRPADTEECLRGIAEEVALLDRLVGDLLDAARLESSPATLEPVAFELFGWAEDTARRLEREVRSRGIDWRVRLPRPPEAQDSVRVHGDPQRLAQAFGNVVDNAVNALLPPASVPRVRPTIEVALSLGSSDWVLSVEDNGRGIPEVDLPYVFRRFYRVGGDRGRGDGGVGLGLSLVRAIVESHGGRVTLDSRLDKGTRDEMIFPRAP